MMVDLARPGNAASLPPDAQSGRQLAAMPMNEWPEERPDQNPWPGG